MKPSQSIRSGARKFPVVECCYQTPMLNPSSAPSVKKSNSLWNIGRDYFDGESNREFAADVAVFGTLIAMAIFPIVAGLSAVVQLLRALPLF